MALAEEHDIAASGKTRRIEAFDLIRGFMLIIILIGHIELPPNLYDFFTGRGRLFVSAAEGFFFLSGLLVGMVYRRRISRGFRFIFKKMWSRAAELYVGSVVFTLLFSFIVAKTNHFHIKEGLPNPVDWSHLISQTLTLRFEYGWADFLGRFAILMLFAPVIFYLISKGFWKFVLAGMIALYILRGENFTFGWQIIFNGGMLIGFYWKEINAWWEGLSVRASNALKRSFISITAVSFIYSYAVVYILSELNTHYKALPESWKNFTQDWDSVNNFIWTYADKWTMGPVRMILFFVWGTVAFMLVKRYGKKLNGRVRNVLLLLGMNGLFVYIFHSFIVFIFKFFIPGKTNPVQNFIIISFALALLISGTYLYQYLWLSRPKDKRPSLKEFWSRKTAAESR